MVTPDKRADAHYQTAAHAAWSLAVKERAGWRCQGAHHDEAMPRHGVMLYADHIKELRDAPHLALDIENGEAICASCHGRKTAAERARRNATL